MENQNNEVAEAPATSNIQTTDTTPNETQTNAGFEHGSVVTSPDGNKEKIVIEEDGSWHKEAVQG